MLSEGVEYTVKKSDDEWKAELDDARYYILREKGTERPGTSELNKFYPKDGHFQCAGCGQPLYSAAAKFDSGCGWPAFDKIVEGAVVTQTDVSLGMSRVEIMCSSCGGHLGHVRAFHRPTSLVMPACLLLNWHEPPAGIRGRGLHADPRAPLCQRALCSLRGGAASRRQG